MKKGRTAVDDREDNVRIQEFLDMIAKDEVLLYGYPGFVVTHIVVSGHCGSTRLLRKSRQFSHI